MIKKMNLFIEVKNQKPEIIHGVLAVLGKIYIGDFKETIYIPLDYWSLDDYKRQWKEGLERIKTHDTSCLVATIHDPGIRPYINWWLLYKVGDKVYIQNKLYLSDIYKRQIGDKLFTIDNCYEFITPRRINKGKKEEDKVSEWVVTL